MNVSRSTESSNIYLRARYSWVNDNAIISNFKSTVVTTAQGVYGNGDIINGTNLVVFGFQSCYATNIARVKNWY